MDKLGAETKVFMGIPFILEYWNTVKHYARFSVRIARNTEGKLYIVYTGINGIEYSHTVGNPSTIIDQRSALREHLEIYS